MDTIKKILAKVRLYWSYFIDILVSDAFILTLPFAVLSVTALVTSNGLIVIALFLWVIAILAKLSRNEKQSF
jgi:hypothetical protein